MHGHTSVSAVLVNAEVDSMGGVIDGGIGINSKSSPRHAAIEKAQAELRQEYDVREERRKELEFLEKGGNPLDFKLRPTTSISVQSTSFTDQPTEQLVTSEAKGSFALAASPHGDSVESSGRPGVPSTREPNSGDNLLLFDSESHPHEGKRNFKQTGRRSNLSPSEHSSRLDGNHKAKESEDSVIFRLVKSQAYARRNRSRSSRESAHACSADVVPPADGNGSSGLFAARHGSRDAKGSLSEAKAQNDHIVSSISNSKSTGPNGSLVSKIPASATQVDVQLDALQARTTATGLPKTGVPEMPEVLASKDLQNGNDNAKLPVGDNKVAPDLDKQGGEAGLNLKSSTVIANAEDDQVIGELSGFNTPNGDEKDTPNEDQNGITALSTKGLDSESSSTQVAHSLEGNAASDSHLKQVHANVSSEEQKSIEESLAIADADAAKQNSENKDVDDLFVGIDIHDSVQQNLSNSASNVKFEEEICDNRTDLQYEGRSSNNIERTELRDIVGSKTENKLGHSLGDNSSLKKAACSPQGGPSSTAVSSNCDLPDSTPPGRGLVAASDSQTCDGNQLKVLNEEHENFILKEAQTIKAKRKRISELCVADLPSEYRCKSHWDFVIEEMTWLANDFMQERIWKMTAATHLCHLVASTGRLRFDEQNLCQKQKKVAHILAKAVMQFWRSAETFVSSNESDVGLHEWKSALVGTAVNVDIATEDRIGEPNMETSKHLKEQNCGHSPQLAIQRYAVRFLKCNSFHDHPHQAEAPVTPDRISDTGILEREEHFSKESLFFTVLPYAMENYRKSVESHWAQHEKTGNSMRQGEVDTSMCDALSEFGSRENAYEEDGVETGVYYSPGNFQGQKYSKFAQRKRKTLLTSCSPRSYKVGSELSYGMGNKLASQPSSLIGKRPNSVPVGSIPTKRMRTAARQRLLNPFSAAAAGNLPITSKTDASSGDTSSFQDDQSTLHGESEFRKPMEVESTGEFSKRSPFNYADISTKPKKKKKAKHLLCKNSLHATEAAIGKGIAYEQRWQLDSMVQHEQRDHAKKRSEGHYFESNGNSGLFGQHAAKKPKIMKQLADTCPENFDPVTSSIPSPVGSQMSNMSNPNKLMKMIAGRDRGRKAKAPKTPAGQSGSGSPWSLFEDQALVVLVHDMGPNWNLVTDAINSTLQFKCIFREPKECKERHKILMDRNGDGADSAEDSGSSQPYPSTLPGIPKGSARQLFQHLQGPMEEDTLKSHFEKIILLGQQLHSRRSQTANQELKQIAPVHNSHMLAVSQVCPNTCPLTPLDLCDATTSNPDISYQGPHKSGIGIPNQGSLAPVLSTSGATAMLQGSSNMTLGCSLMSPSAALSAPTRDGQRYGAPRPASLPIDEQQRIQQYNQMLSGRNIQQSGMAVPGAMSGTDRGVRMIHGGNGMGMMCGMNRPMPISRPGFQGIGSPAMLNSGNMLPPGGGRMPSPVNMHPGAVSGQGNSMLGARDSLHLMRPGQNPEDQRQMMMQELQMQVTQGSSQVVPSYNGLSSAFPNQTISPPVQTFPVQHQQQMPPQQSHLLGSPHHSRLQGNSHATNPRHQAYVLRLAKERQLQQQRYLHQQQQQQQNPFTASNPLVPHPQPQSQHPVSSSMQNNSQIQKQVSSPANSQQSMIPSSPRNPMSSQPQQKHNLPTQGLGRSPQAGGVSLPNQVMKQQQQPQQQQQQQQLQQPGRHHPQQRQQSQSLQQQAKLMKGLGRGNMMHQNHAVDSSSHANGLPATQENRLVEKGEQVMHLMHGPGLYSGSGSNSIQPGKQLTQQSSNQCQQQQKMFPRPLPPSSKQLSQMPSHSDNCHEGQVPTVTSGHILPSQQPVPSLSTTSLCQQQQPQPQPPPQTQPRQAGQPHAAQRMVPQNHQMDSDPPMQSLAEHIQNIQQPGNKSFHQMVTTTKMSQACSESTVVAPVVSTASTPQWKASEPLYDAGSPNAATNSAAIGNSPLPNNVGTESVASPSQVLAQRPFSGCMPIHGQKVGTQRLQPLQHQSSEPPLLLPPPLPSSPLPSASQQQQTPQIQQQQHHHHPQPPHHPPLEPAAAQLPQSNLTSQHHQDDPAKLQHTQQPHLPAGENGLSTRHANSGSG